MNINKKIRFAITVMVLLVTLAMTAAGCGNQSAFVSQSGNNGEEVTEEAGLEQPDIGQQTDADEQAPDDQSEPAEKPDAEPELDIEEISISDIDGITIGQTENAEAGTGCTVFISKDGMAAGLDVRGGGPASRESELLDPLAAASSIHAIVLSGGSAYGLGTADGVMKYLEEKDIGYDTGVAKVPLVAQADLYDLSVGDSSVRPDADMGYEAARIAMESPNYKDGNFGA